MSKIRITSKTPAIGPGAIWVKGVVTPRRGGPRFFEAKVYDEPSVDYGLRGSRVVKLFVGKTVAHDTSVPYHVQLAFQWDRDDPDAPAPAYVLDLAEALDRLP